MPATDVFGWTMPTVGGSSGTWGTELNDLIDDEIEEQVNSNKTTADAALPKAGGVMTGEIDVKTERFVTSDKGGSVSGAVTFDLDTANAFFGTVSGDITGITFSNIPAGPDAVYWTIELHNGGAHSITWPSAVRWDGGGTPTLQTTGVDVLTFYTRDGGTTIYASVAHSSAD